MKSHSFADLGVSSVVVRALQARGIASPFAVQQTVVPDVLAGHDVLVQSPTGSGKTLAFGLGLVDRIEATDRRAAALVLAPTRELATQIGEELMDLARARALSVAVVYGGAGIEPQIKRARKAHILVATPGRLEDLIARDAVRLDRVRVLVLDEADRMLDMGFRPVVDRIVGQTPADRQTLFFSATLEGEAGRIAAAYTREPRRHSHLRPDADRHKIEHRFLAVRHEAKLDSLVQTLREGERGRTLVFVRTKRGADRLVKRLDGRNLAAAAMHGNKTQPQRERALRGFHAGTVDTLVATDVAARGIDVDQVTHVINYDAPDGADAYTHRIGRTGRAGGAGVGITFVTTEQAAEVHRIATELRLEEQFGRAGLRPGGQDRSSRRASGGGRSAGGRSAGAHSAAARKRGRRRPPARARQKT